LLHGGFIDSERAHRTARRVNGCGSPPLTIGRWCRRGWRGEDSRIGDDDGVDGRRTIPPSSRARRRVLLLVRRRLKFGRRFGVAAPPPRRGGDVEAGGYGAPPSRRPPLPFLLLLLPLLLPGSSMARTPRAWMGRAGQRGHAAGIRGTLGLERWCAGGQGHGTGRARVTSGGGRRGRCPRFVTERRWIGKSEEAASTQRRKGGFAEKEEKTGGSCHAGPGGQRHKKGERGWRC
jgi:hypothetical protein